MSILMYQGYIPPPKKNRRPIDEIAPKNKLKNNLNTELTEMGVFSAVAGKGGSYVIFLDSNIEHRTSGIIM